MTLFDYIVFGICGLSVVIGLYRGLVKEVFSLLGLVLAIYIMVKYGSNIEAMLRPFISHDEIRYGLAYMGLFFLVLLIMGYAIRSLRAVIEFSGLGLLDYILGIVFGCLRGLTVVLVLYTLGSLTSLTQETWWQESMTRPLLDELLVSLKSQFPAEFSRLSL